MSSKHTHHPKEDAPIIDESWWAALLAEEEKHAASSATRPPAPRQTESKDAGAHAPSKQPAVDWDLAEQLFSEDRSILLTVSGFNRGGLLVDGGELHGFVPVSHLVQVACDLSEDDRALLKARAAALVAKTENSREALLKVVKRARQQAAIMSAETPAGH